MRNILVFLCMVGVIRGHLLPQALEDVHAFVQSELRRSQGDHKLGIDSPPSGGPSFQTAQTQTYIGVPVVIQKELKFDGRGGIANSDLAAAASQNVPVQSGDSALPRGLLPPSPLEQQITSASNNNPQIIPANLVGPSTYISDGQVTVPPQILNADGGSNQKTMEGWVPMDGQGSHFAKGVGVKLQVEETSQQPQEENHPEPAYKGTGYSIREAKATDDKSELEILPTNSVKLEDIIISTKQQGKGRFPVYNGGARNPKVVIHAQNVIIRDQPETDVINNGSNIRQFPAYSGIPQLNNYLRDQLRLAAMNRLIQANIQLPPILPPHPLSNKPFPRPLSLREIARAVRNGDFPEPPQDSLLDQSSQMQISIPHMVKLNPDVASSIQSQTKVPFPGGLASLYRNALQGPSQGPFDPRDPIEYSLLAAMSGQNQKVPQFKSKPDYGDSVGYTTGEKEPIQVLPAEPSYDRPTYDRPHPGNPGSLKDVSEQLLKQMILQELQEIQDTPSNPFQNPARFPLRRPGSRQPHYGTNAHPFAHLGNDGAAPGDAVFEETFEYSLPPGVSVEDYMNDDGKLYGHLRKRPSTKYRVSGYPSGGAGTEDSDTAVPLNKDTLMEFGKGLFNSALEFSRHHNPLTLISKIRSLPPVKVDLYKVPMGIPENFMEKLPEKWRGGDSRRGGQRGGPRGKRRNLPRKNGSNKY